jgi:uncharacterized protein YjbJ (UPF0337 family)
MDKLEIEGAADKAIGKLKEVAGKITNSPTTVAEGKADQVKGELKEQTGKVRDEVTTDYPRT